MLNSLRFKKNFLFFLTRLLCFSSKSLHPESISNAMFTLSRNERFTWMLICLPGFSCYKIFSFKCFKSVTPFVVQQLSPPTTILHLQTPILDSSSADCCKLQIKQGLYFRSPRLAIKFKSTAANIAKVLVTALLNTITKFHIQEIQVEKPVKITFPLFFLNSLLKPQKPLATGGHITMFLVANCLVSFFQGCAEDSPKSPNSSVSVLKTSSHKRRRWKRAKDWLEYAVFHLEVYGHCFVCN